MTLTFSRLLADAWSLFRRQADLILRIALPLVVFPAFAVQLLCDPLPPLPPRSGGRKKSFGSVFGRTASMSADLVRTASRTMSCESSAYLGS